MNKLMTPFGEINICIDDTPIDYTARKGSDSHISWPDVRNRFQIIVNYTPDGNQHSISCVFSPTCSYETDAESGERLECQSFYNSERVKMSIGIECETDCIDGLLSEYDYGGGYLDNGMFYIILPETKTEKYVFGIAWIDNLGWDDPIDQLQKRGTQTWYAADPSYRL